MEDELEKVREELINFYLNIKIRTQDEVNSYLKYIITSLKLIIGRIINRGSFNKRN